MASPYFFTPGSRRRDGGFIARDPRVLIAGFSAIVVATFVVPGTWGLVVVSFYLLALHRISGLPSRSLVGAVRLLGPFVLIVVAVNAVLVGGEPLARIPFASREGVASGLHAAARVVALYLSALVFLAAASAEDVARGIASLVRPFSPSRARRVAVYGFVTFGFLPLFADELERIVVAQKFRGAGFDRGLVRRIAAARLLVVPLVVSAIRRSEQLALSVELRRVRSRIGGILVLENPAAKDYLFLVVTLAVLVAAGRLP